MSLTLQIFPKMRLSWFYHHIQIAMVLGCISCQSIRLFDDTNLNMELETMDIVDMVASSDVRCCSM